MRKVLNVFLILILIVFLFVVYVWKSVKLTSPPSAYKFNLPKPFFPPYLSGCNKKSPFFSKFLEFYFKNFNNLSDSKKIKMVKFSKADFSFKGIDPLLKLLFYYSKMKKFSPTMMVKVDIKNLTLLDWFRMPALDYTFSRELARSAIGLAIFKFLQEKEVKESLKINYIILKYGVDLSYNFGLPPTLLSTMVSSAIEKIGLQLLGFILVNSPDKLSFSKEKFIIEKFQRILRLRVPILVAFNDELFFFHNFDFKKDYYSLFDLLGLDENGIIKQKNLMAKFFLKLVLFLEGDNVTKQFKSMFNQLYFLANGLLKKDGTVPLTLLKKYEDEFNKKKDFIAKLSKSYNFSVKFASLTCSIIFPDVPKAYFKWKSPECLLNGLKVISYLNEYYRRKGNYPDNLEELRKELNLDSKSFPKDIYNGKDFIYRKNGKRFLLYSVGENFKDDGGGSYKDLMIYPSRM